MELRNDALLTFDAETVRVSLWDCEICEMLEQQSTWAETISSGATVGELLKSDHPVEQSLISFTVTALVFSSGMCLAMILMSHVDMLLVMLHFSSVFAQCLADPM